LSLVLKQEDKNISQTIKKENIINECYKIHNYISEHGRPPAQENDRDKKQL
jgi:hypothetical protein